MILKIAGTRHTARMGLSLLELILSFFILVVAVLSVSGLISFGHRGTQKDFRFVQAVQLLEERMNRILLVPATQLFSLITAGGSAPQTFSTPLAVVPAVPLGSVMVGVASFSVTATMNRQPVSFSTRELDIINSPAYDKTDPATWRFTNSSSANGTFDGSSLPYRVLKIIVTVSWVELLNNTPRKIEAVSFAVDYNL